MPVGVDQQGRPTWIAAQAVGPIPAGFVNWNGTDWEIFDGTVWQPTTVPAPGLFWAEANCDVNGEVEYCKLHSLCPQPPNCPGDPASGMPTELGVTLKVSNNTDFVWLEFDDEGRLCVRVNWANVDEDLLLNDPEFCAALLTKVLGELDDDFITAFLNCFAATTTETKIPVTLLGLGADGAKLRFGWDEIRSRTIQTFQGNSNLFGLPSSDPAFDPAVDSISLDVVGNFESTDGVNGSGQTNAIKYTNNTCRTMVGFWHFDGVMERILRGNGHVRVCIEADTTGDGTFDSLIFATDYQRRNLDASAESQDNDTAFSRLRHVTIPPGGTFCLATRAVVKVIEAFETGSRIESISMSTGIHFNSN